MFEVYRKAVELPAFWDEIVKEDPFLNKQSLISLEILNPCEQTYHLNISSRIALVCYKLQLDLFTYADRPSLKVPVNVIGVPMSVSRCGYCLEDKEALPRMEQYVMGFKGFTLILNSEDNFGFSRGSTLPDAIMEMQWESMEEYYSLLRSSYRYRLKKAERKFSKVQVEELKNNCSFDEDMYLLYEEVYNQSKAKLEKLNQNFFKHYPSKILKFTAEGAAIAFLQLIENGEELIFLFGGFSHILNKEYDLYMNMLLKIVEYGTRGGFKRINFGQTSEETKLKLGAVQNPKNMYVYHSNKVLNLIIKSFINKFAYSKYETTHRVFKEQEEQQNDIKEGIAG
jgi:hypothetical protein